MFSAAIWRRFLRISQHVITRSPSVKRQFLPNIFWRETAFVPSSRRTYNAVVANVIERQSIGRGFATLKIFHTRRSGQLIVLSVRPKVAELAFQLFGRALHPELFEVYKTRTIKRGDYEAKLDITSAGHIVTWKHRGLTLTEVACSATHPLPEKRRLLSYRLKGQKSDKVEARGGITYQMNFHLEPVPAEVFWAFQEELGRDGEREGLLHTFDSSGRMALGAISFLSVEERQRSLRIQAFHTFPDDYAIVKTQSIFELPS